MLRHAGPNGTLHHAHQDRRRDSMPRDIGQIAGYRAIEDDSIDEVATHGSARLALSADFQSADRQMYRGHNFPTDNRPLIICEKLLVTTDLA